MSFGGRDDGVFLGAESYERTEKQFIELLGFDFDSVPAVISNV